MRVIGIGVWVRVGYKRVVIEGIIVFKRLCSIEIGILNKRCLNFKFVNN